MIFRRGFVRNHRIELCCVRHWHWQTFPGREVARRNSQGPQTCPRKALASVLRQAICERPRLGLQPCPGWAMANLLRQRLASVPNGDGLTCSDRALANISRQGTVDVPRHGVVVVPRKETVVQILFSLRLRQWLFPGREPEALQKRTAQHV